jgi:thiol-disulfide isomerase/thioredoxin
MKLFKFFCLFLVFSFAIFGLSGFASDKGSIAEKAIDKAEINIDESAIDINKSEIDIDARTYKETPLKETPLKEIPLKEIPQGKEFAIKNYLVAGKTVIFDFFSPWCPPCVRIKPYLKKLDAQRDDIVINYVNINRPGINGIDWSSPIVKQYKIESVPHFKIYDEKGNLKAEGREAFDLVSGFIKSLE